MSLIYSPLEGVGIHQLGVEGAAGQYYNKDTEDYVYQKGNMSIYLSCLVCLIHGRRDLLPLTWAWSNASERCQLDEWKPDWDENVLIHFRNLKWFERFRSYMMDNLEGFPVKCVVGGIDLWDFFTRLENLPTKNMKGKGKLNEGAALITALEVMEVSDEEHELVALISKFVAAGSLIAFYAYKRFELLHLLPPEEIEPRMRIRAADDIHLADKHLSPIVGNSFTHIIVASAFAYLDVSGVGSDMGVVWEAMYSNYGGSQYRKVKVKEPPTLKAPEFEAKYMRAKMRLPEAPAKGTAERSVWENLNASLDDSVESLADAYPHMEAIISSAKNYLSRELHMFVPMTFMSRAAYEGFKKDGKVRTFWDLYDAGELKNSWHFNNSDDPVAIRAVADMRLWGERGRDITYGALVHKADVETINTFHRMYGDVCIEWKRDILDWSTLTTNDSHLGAFPVLATPTNQVKHLIPVVLSSFDGTNVERQGYIPTLSRHFFGAPMWINFIEFQSHTCLRSEDVVEVRVKG